MNVCATIHKWAIMSQIPQLEFPENFYYRVPLACTCIKSSKFCLKT